MTTPASRSIKLELLRAGPVHGQPLSPLTPYIALCGDDGPVTFHVPFEHYRFMNRLKRLRYVIPSASGGANPIPDSLREAEIDELGRDLGQLLSAIPTLTSELGRAACSNDGTFNLRVVMSGSELALLPFEALVSPQGYPGEGLPLALQTSTPITITREVRRGHPARFEWDREPNVLFIVASPGGLEVPMEDHLLALRTALEPWVRWCPDPEERVAHVEKRLTVLLDASLPEIEAVCAAQSFTHVHILAHGAELEDESDLRYGLVLSDANDKSRPAVVDGRRLAIALTNSKCHGEAASAGSPPVVVSLATCDSGNTGDVLVPGGSVAHVLQSFGIPWVFASQFPLTKRGSVRMTEMLYEELLSGEDPRETLRHLRESLHVNARHDHDWASLVGYVTVCDDFDDMLDSLWVKHKRALINRDFERCEDLRAQLQACQNPIEAEVLRKKLKGHLTDAQTRLGHWDKRLPDDGSKARRALRAECHGLQGAGKKRMAEIRFICGQPPAEWQRDLRAALAYYSASLEEGAKDVHWQTTQYLSLVAILGQAKEPLLFQYAVRWATMDLAKESAESRAWAHGTLAELEMLRSYHDRGEHFAGEDAAQRVREHCREIVRLLGPDSFPAFSTRRQFLRYRDWWKLPESGPIVEAALSALSDS